MGMFLLRGGCVQGLFLVVMVGVGLFFLLFFDFFPFGEGEVWVSEHLLLFCLAFYEFGGVF